MARQSTPTPSLVGMRYLSPQWIETLAETVGTVELATDTPDVCIEHTVTGAPDGDVVYHLRISDAALSAAEGRADNADVRFTQTYESALAIARGETSAQAAFMSGRLRVGGDVRALIDSASVFEDLDRALSPLRDLTDDA